MSCTPSSIGRKRTGQIWHSVFLAATVVGVIALLALLYNVINESFGYVAYQNEVDPSTLTLNYYKDQVLSAKRLATSEDDSELVKGIQGPAHRDRLLRLFLLRSQPRCPEAAPCRRRCA